MSLNFDIWCVLLNQVSEMCAKRHLGETRVPRTSCLMLERKYNQADRCVTGNGAGLKYTYMAVSSINNQGNALLDFAAKVHRYVY